MDLNNFSVAQPRPLPVFILADTSGSMAGAKIQSLNAALRDMVAALRNIQDMRSQVELALFTFGAGVNIIQNLTPISEVALPELTATGKTPMGAAFDLLRQTVEDKSIVPTKAFSPTVVLVSDGLPTDLSAELRTKVENNTARKEDFLSWQPLKAFITSERGSKCFRLAMGIGDDTNDEMLQAFVNAPDVPLIRAHDAHGIAKFFRWVTMSVSVRLAGRNPNSSQAPTLEGFDDDEFVL